MKRPAAVLLLTVALACHGQHGPTDPTAGVPFGTLSGAVTIGPNCPVQTPDNPCPTPPGAYASRKVLIFDPDASKLLFTVDIDGHGFYTIDLAATQYVVDLKKSGLDRTSDVPKKVTINKGAGTRLDISIDTGIR